MNKLILKKIIENALIEDIGHEDITSLNTVPEDTIIKGNLIAKENCILCGSEVLREVFHTLDPAIDIRFNFKDGNSIKNREIIGVINGNARSVLNGERVALNFLQHMCGIATYTKFFTEKIKHTSTRIIDTRKTTPGLRILEKYAVKTGGGANHRFNLSDGVLIKDNHIKAAGGIKNAIEAARKNIPHCVKIEIETETMEDVTEAIENNADIIMLDNMSNEMMKNALVIINGRAITEASGNMDQKDIVAIADLGVDLISIGGLTHSVKATDISLKFI